MESGIDIDRDMHIRVLENKVSMAAVREAQMEAVIQSLIAENKAVKGHLEALMAESTEEAPLANTTD